MNNMIDLLELWERNMERYQRRRAEGKSTDGTKARLDKLKAQVLSLCREMEESA